MRKVTSGIEKGDECIIVIIMQLFILVLQHLDDEGGAAGEQHRKGKGGGMH